MKKCHYDMMVKDYSKESKEELVQRIMAESEIETSDREFANHCLASTIAADINEMFEIMNDLKQKFSYSKAAKLYEASDKAEKGWKFILSRLQEINDPKRSSEAFENFKERVANASSPDDSI